jgi:uncharacterized protein YbjT (DUF2867 family)
MKTAVIAGATGLVGKQLLEKLLASVRYTRVVALTRSPLAGNHPSILQCPPLEGAQISICSFLRWGKQACIALL